MIQNAIKNYIVGWSEWLIIRIMLLKSSQLPLIQFAAYPSFELGLNPSLTAGAKFAFDIYDFEGKSRMDLFYLGDCLRNIQTDNQQIEN